MMYSSNTNPLNNININNSNSFIKYKLIISGNGDWKQQFLKLCQTNYGKNFFNGGLSLRVSNYQFGPMNTVLNKYNRIIFILENVGITAFMSAVSTLFMDRKKLHNKCYDIHLFFKFDIPSYYNLVESDFNELTSLEFVTASLHLYTNCKEFDHKTTSTHISWNVRTSRINVNNVIDLLKTSSNSVNDLTAIYINNKQTECYYKLKKTFDANYLNFSNNIQLVIGE